MFDSMKRCQTFLAMAVAMATSAATLAQDPITLAPNGPARRATYGLDTAVVAASNSSQLAKSRAGWVCDGTADDVEINAALSSGVSRVFLPEGTYRTTGTISIPSNTEFYGAGPGTLIKLADTGEGSLTGVAMLEMLGAATPVQYSMVITDQTAATSGIYVHDMSIDGNEANIQAASYLVSFSGLTLYNTSDSVVERVNIADCNSLISVSNPGEYRNFCLLVAKADRITIRGGKFGNAGYETIGIRGDCETIMIDGVNVVKHATVDHGRHAIQVSTPDSATYPTKDVFVINSHTSGFNAQFITHSCPNVSLIGCSFDVTGTTDIGVTIMDTASYVTVMGCRFYGAGSTCRGVNFTGDATEFPTYCDVIGCTFNTNSYCVDVAAGKNISIIGNQMTTPIRHCIEVDVDVPADDLGDIKIIGNNCVVTGGTSNNATIELEGVTRAIVRDNTLTAAANYSTLILDASTNVVVEGNTFNVSGSGVGITLLNTPTYVARDNVGWVDADSGTATVASGATTVDVTHGLAFTPTAKHIVVTPTNNLGNASHYWVSDLGATTFRINVDADPGATTATFAWVARQTW